MRTSLAPVVMLALCGALALPLGCGGRTDLAPPEIHYGADVCERCNMIISEERFAAALVLQREGGSYAPLVFDDIGCLFERARTVTDPIAAFYIHDAESGAWIDATTATFVVSPRIQSPMGSGTLAYSTAERAGSNAGALGGERLNWVELRGKADRGKLMTTFQPGAASTGPGVIE